MPSYKLTYFNVRGRAETARMLFKLAGQDFEDLRLSGEKWQELKKSAPMGQMPILDIDGTKICQSNAIARYLAREFGFAGKDSVAMAQVDMVVDSIEDVIHKAGPWWAAKTDEEKAEAAKKFIEEAMEPGFTKIEAMLEQNNGGNGFFVGDELTFADLTFVNIGGLILTLMKTDLSKFPKLVALVERVESIPKIAAWIKERPVTER